MIDFNSGKLDHQLVEHFAGVSPLFAKEVIFKSGLANRTTVPKTFVDLIKKIDSGQLAPSIITSGGKENFYLFPLEHLKGESRTFATLSLMLDRYYFGKAERDRVKQQGHDIERLIVNEKEKNEKKIDKLVLTLKDAERADQFQRYGELLTANLYAAKKGMKEIEVLNYYDEAGGTLLIPLDPRKTPSENAQKYFSKYQKAKNAKSVVVEQIEKAREEAAYFDNLLQQVQSCIP